MKLMRALVSLLVTLALALGIYYFYLKRMQPAGPASATTQAISLTGVQNDLIALAQAERGYFAQNGSYASLGELVQSGTLTMPRSGRDGYTYSIETSANGFTVTARYLGEPGDPAGPRHPTITVDQNMQFRQPD
jgi:hypothetical protein